LQSGSFKLRDTPHTSAEWSCSQTLVVVTHLNSRIAYLIRLACSDRPFNWYTAAPCRRNGRLELLLNTPLHPVVEWGRQRFGGTEIPADRRLADLENTLALLKLDSEENAPLLAALLDIPLPPERAPALTSAELRRRQLAALTNLVMAGARTQPAVLAVEDCIGPIRQRSTCWEPSPSAARRRRVSSLPLSRAKQKLHAQRQNTAVICKPLSQLDCQLKLDKLFEIFA
jgi:hypothetical protein